jgi:hypothetical protein
LKHNPIPQLGAAMALVELVKEASAAGLTPVAWHVGALLDSLDGNLHCIEEPLKTLTAYAGLLGGQVAARHKFMSGGRRFQSYGVSVVWRDVEVLLTTGVPVEARTAVAA